MRMRRGPVLILLMAASILNVSAAALRDPTQPPALLAGAGTTRNPADIFQPQHLVIIGGERFLIWQGRRYRAGEQFGGGRIERITEAEVWLRGANGLRKLPLFPSTEKRLSGTSKAAATNNTSTAGMPAGNKEQLK